MQVGQLQWDAARGWSRFGEAAQGNADLVLYFGARSALADGERHRELREAFPRAHVLGCSTGGQLLGDEIQDVGVAAIAVGFDATRLRLASEPVSGPEASEECGARLGRALAADDLAGVFLLSDGLHVNGSGLASGLAGAVGEAVPVTGGLAGDGGEFRETLVGAGDLSPASRRVAALGFYGSAVRVGHGSAGGWDAFGPFRRITRSEGNVLFELDGKPALDLYERYLGDEAAALPGSALLFPLRVWDPRRPEHDVVRTVLGVDRERRTMTFAGDVPKGWGAQLMRGGFDRLTAGAGDAARQAVGGIAGVGGDSLAILISCIGRRLLMGQHAADEVEAVGARLGGGVTRLGFYSYGEISPHAVSGACELHNQTMTVTTIAEAA